MNKQRKLILTIPLTLLVAGVLFFLYRLTSLQRWQSTRCVATRFVLTMLAEPGSMADRSPKSGNSAGLSKAALNECGSYSQRKASAKKLAEPVANRVFFAGEAMNPNGKTIAVHGASESAYSAVNAMLTSPDPAASST